MSFIEFCIELKSFFDHFRNMDVADLVNKYGLGDETGSNEAVRQRKRGEEPWIVWASDLVQDPKEAEVVIDAFYQRLNPEKYEVIAGFGYEGLTIGALLTRKEPFNLGICWIDQRYVRKNPWGNEGYHHSLEHVSGKKVLVTMGSIIHAFDSYNAVRAVLEHGGKPVTLAALFDSDRIRVKAHGEPEDLKEAMIQYGKENEKLQSVLKELEIEVLVKASDLIKSPVKS